ncbi:MAG: MMPL family transporter [Deltaproteobacteria bacterium]|nr:MMPL family transporter [Deltaproteobacteria bacterium]
MARVMIWCRDHGLLVLAIILAITVFFGYFALRTRIDASASGMMIEGDPELHLYQNALKTFGSDDVTVVYIRDKNLFTPGVLQAVQAVYYALQDIPGVTRVDSLFNAVNLKNDGGVIFAGPLLDWIPEDSEELALIRQDAVHNPLLYKTLISRDGQGMAINIMVEPKSGATDYYKRITADIETAIQPLKGQVEEVFQLGMPYLRTELAELILGDQLTLVPLSIGVVLLILMVCLRSVNGAIIPCLTASLSIIWTLGFMALLDIPVNVLTVIVPSLIIVIGSTEDMHIVSEYFAGLEAGHERMAAIEHTAHQVGLAILLTAVTTYLGFLSIAVNKITLLREFGLVASFGLAANFLITLSVDPVYLRYFGDRKSPAQRRVKVNAAGHSFFNRLATVVVRLVRTRRGVVLWGLLAGAYLIGMGSLKIRVNNDLLGYFKQDSPINVRSRMLHRDMSGAQNFFITLDAGLAGAFKLPEKLDKIFAIEKYLQDGGRIDATLSLADYIALVNREMKGGQNEAYVIPESADLIAQYLLLFQRYDLERYVSADYSKTNIIVRHNISSSHELRGVVKDLESFMSKTLGPGVSYTVTSEGILINKAADTMATGQALSLSLLLLVIFILMSFLFVRFKAGFLSLIPNLFPIIIIFGIMGLANIPLNTGTAMIAAIAIGIAVDDTVHLMVRYNSEMKRLNDQEEAMVTSIHSEIRPVMTTSMALAVGFALLSFSHFVPVIYFGVLSALVMLLALIGDLFLTPVLLISTRLITLWDMLTLDLRERVVKKSPLFEGMSSWQMKKIVLVSHVQTFSPGSYIIRKNELERVMYMLLDGTARAEVDRKDGRKEQLQELHPGDVFGEIALVNAVRRTADVVAVNESEVLCIDWESLQRLRRIFPHISSRLFLNISKILGERLAVRTEEWICRQHICEVCGKPF